MPPRSKKGIQKLCGFLNWFRPFIPGLSLLAKPITDKLKQEKDFTWKEEDTEQVNKIMKEIEKETCLKYPDYNLPFTLQTDASDYGICGVLTQGESIIGFFSRKLSPAQTRYTVSEKELLAVIEALKHFKSIVYLSRINIQTDHSNLLYNTDLENNRSQRWKLL